MCCGLHRKFGGRTRWKLCVTIVHQSALRTLLFECAAGHVQARDSRRSNERTGATGRPDSGMHMHCPFWSQPHRSSYKKRLNVWIQGNLPSSINAVWAIGEIGVRCEGNASILEPYAPARLLSLQSQQQLDPRRTLDSKKRSITPLRCLPEPTSDPASRFECGRLSVIVSILFAIMTWHMP